MPAGSVLLLRSPSEDPGVPDKYEDAFRARGYRAFSIPVLETVHTNADQLTAVVRARGRLSAGRLGEAGGADEDGDEDEKGDGRYAGVVVTSARACEAWRAVVQHLLRSEPSSQKHGGQPIGEEGWSTIPFYVVGQATAAALSDIHASFPSSPYVPHDIRGAASGTGEKLAHFIVSDLSEGEQRKGKGGGKGAKTLLYLTGDKNRDTVPSILTRAGFVLDNLQVYATQGSSRFEDDLANALDGPQALDPEREEHWWIVHFAPSSAMHVLPTLRKQFDIPSKDDSKVRAALRRARIAAIGPTTSAFLESELNVRVDVVPAQPTPGALVDDIARWDSENGLSRIEQ